MSTICKCPICEDGELVEKDKLFECSNSKSEKNDQNEWINTGTCSFKVFKSGLSKLGYPEITADDICRLVDDGECEFNLVSQKSGKPYTAKGVIDEKFGVKINFDFDKK